MHKSFIISIVHLPTTPTFSQPPFSHSLFMKLSVSEFQWCHSHISSEILAEERSAGEVQRIGYFLYSHIGPFQFCFGVHDNNVSNGIQYTFARYLPHRGTQVLEGDS